MRTFKVLGLLMAYPDPEWLAHLDECRLVLEGEALLPARKLRRVLDFIDKLEATDVYCLQENYVETFDRGRSHSLHLFEHIHGESRDRGQAMADLVDAYARSGLSIDQPELPDYLPLFLEYLSLRPLDQALALLAEPVDIIATIAGRLDAKRSMHAPLFDALVALSTTKPDVRRVRQALKRTKDETSPEALDKEWEEAAAFGDNPQQAGCGSCGQTNGSLDVKITQ